MPFASMSNVTSICGIPLGAVVAAQGMAETVQEEGLPVIVEPEHGVLLCSQGPRDLPASPQV